MLSALPETSYQFLLTCLHGYWDPPALEPADRLVEEGIDWPLFSEIVLGQRLAPILYETLRDRQLLPTEVEHPLRKEYLRTALRNGLLLAELGELLQKLNGVGVSVMPVKGAALAGPVYRNPAVRPMADLDLLVAPAEATVACETLTGLGYKANILEPWPNYTRRYRQVLEFSRATTKGVYYLIDLHWGVVDVPFYERIPISTWFTQAGSAPIGEVESPVPAAEDHFLYLSAQLAFHERYADDLLRYCDLATLITVTGTNFDWGNVLRQALDWQLVIPLQRVCQQLELLWPGTVPPIVWREVDGLSPSLKEHQIHNWVVDRRRNPTSDVLLSVATTKGLKRKVGLFLEQAFPSPSYMRERYDLPRARLWPLAYFRRAGQIIGNLLARWR